MESKGYDWSSGSAKAQGPMWKGTKEDARAERDRGKQAIVEKEGRNKSAARKRDGWACRFPRCICHQKRLHPEVAHVDGDKGIGGDHGERSHVTQLMCLCTLRHQDSRISLHKGTLRIEFLDTLKASGPVRWWANVAVLDNPLATLEQADWQCIGYERERGVLAPLTHEQGEWLERIRELAQ